MIYQSFSPSPALQQFVRNYTIIHFIFSAGETVPKKQRAPKPEEKIVFYIKGSVSRRNAETGNIETPAPVSVFGNQCVSSTFQVTSEFQAFIVYLHPGVLHRLVQIPMTELCHESYDAELFFGTEVRTVNERLTEAKGYLEMISIIEQFISVKCSRAVKKNSVDKIARYLIIDPTSLSLDELAREACLSTRQFHRRFNELIGISPKLFGRLSRFNHAYRYKINNPTTSWSSVAQEFRYTDYHHLEKEFKAFCGLTPHAWVDTHMTSPERILKLR